jgi:hypothetical protein
MTVPRLLKVVVVGGSPEPEVHFMRYVIGKLMDKREEQARSSL